MVRLLPWLLFLIVGFVFWLQVRRATPPGESDGRTYRPRRRFRTRTKAGQDAPVVVRRAELTGLRDAYSGAQLDAARPLVRCSGCLAIYHAESAAVLARDNGGRCAACGDVRFDAVRVI